MGNVIRRFQLEPEYKLSNTKNWMNALLMRNNRNTRTASKLAVSFESFQDEL